MTFADALMARKTLVEKIGYNDAYLVMAVALFIEDPDVDALASVALTEGGNDKKIDLIHLDKEAKRIIFAQGYMGAKKNDSAPANKASDLNTACAWLLSGDISLVPFKLRSIIEGCREALSSGDVDSIDLLYVHNLPESINVARELQTVEDHLRSTLTNKNIIVKSYELGSTKVEHLFSAQESHIAVTEDIPFPGVIGIEQSGDTWKAAVASVAGDWIRDLYKQHGDELYSANYRGFLGADGRRKVNAGIQESVKKTPGDFWAFNNGITILTLEIKRSKSSKGGEKVVLKGVSVINGAQTTGSIGAVDVEEASLSDVKVLCRVIQCSDQQTIDKIVLYNNTQNSITTWDKFSNDEDQKRIDQEFRELGFSYNRKRGFGGGGDQIGIEQVMQPLLAFHGRSTDAVRGKNQLFVQKQLYQNAFDGTKARHILFVYTLSRAIDSKRLELKSKSSISDLIAVEEKQMELLRNLNFKPFFINVIANSLETIIGKPCDSKMVGFKPDAAKSNTVNELAARWVPIVEVFLPLLTALVKPDTFFKLLSSQDGFLGDIKTQMDALLSASQAQGKHSTFAEMVATS